MKRHCCVRGGISRWLIMPLAIVLPLAAMAQIITDTSLGKAALSLKGPAFQIPETLGKLSGNNLFHSFQTFSIRSGESATFATVTPAIANVISRVTGGSASAINGRLVLDAADGAPALFLINPAGVIFGAGAAIDVPGALHVSTADYVRLGDGKFYADPTKVSSFSAAPPEAFGFVGARSSALRLTAGADLLAFPGETVSLIAGDIAIDSARLKADGGQLRLTAVGAAAIEVPLAGALPETTGSLTLTKGGLATVTSSCCGLTGSIKISAGDVLVDGKGVSAGSTGVFGSVADFVGEGARIEIAGSRGVSLLNGGTITARTRYNGDGGSISIRSPQVTIDNADIDVTTLGPGNGMAGTVTIEAGKIVLRNAGAIWAGSESIGGAGTVQLKATESIEIGGRNAAGSRSVIVVQTLDDADPGKAVLDAPLVWLHDDGMISGYSGWEGTAARIEVNARDLILESGGNIYTLGLYALGGTVVVNASNSVRITGKDEALNSSPGADMVSTGILGHGTKVAITAPDITITHGGAIRSENWYRATPGMVNISTQRLALDSGGHISGNALGPSNTPGKGATLVIRASESVRVEGSSNGRDSTIASGTRSGNDAGSINISAPLLRVANGGAVNTSTGRFGTSGAGRIDIAVDRLELVDGGRLASIEFGHAAAGGHIAVLARESITIDGGKIIAQGGNEAAAGRLVLDTPTLTLHNGLITTSNSEAASSGGIEITAKTLRASAGSRIESNSSSDLGAGDIELHVSDLSVFTDSAITTTSAYAGSGGNISFNGSSGGDPATAMLLRNSVITTSVLGTTGDGGDIAIGARALVLESGFIQANTAARNALGGNIAIQVAALLPSGTTLFVGGRTPYEFQSGLENFNVIQAAAPTGINGLINISSPALDISGSLLGLNTQVIDLGGLGRSPCEVSAGSSLAKTGRGGLPTWSTGLLGPTAASIPAARLGMESTSPLLLAQRECGRP